MYDILYSQECKLRSQFYRKVVVRSRKNLQILASVGRHVFCSFGCHFALDQAVDGFQ